MKTNTILIILGSLLIGLFIGATVAPGIFSGQIGYGGMMGRGMAGQNIDRHFIEQMIPHHEGAIAMAQIALLRSKRPEVLSLANAIIEAQQKEIDDMRRWYQEWFGTAVPTVGSGMMGGMHMSSMEGDLDVLESASASDFDREFVEQMIPHHEMAIMMVRMLQASTDRAEMKQLANNIFTSQSREIELMRGWLTAW